MPHVDLASERTGEFRARDYGLVVPSRVGAVSSLRIFKSPAYAALAIVASNPSAQIEKMYLEWRKRKEEERKGEAGYSPRFPLSYKDDATFVTGDESAGWESIRSAVKRNHGTMKLIESSGIETIREIATLGNNLTARVSSAGNRPMYDVSIDGVWLDERNRLSYGPSRCGCPNNFWSEEKGGRRFDMQVHCRHIEIPFVELAQELSDTRHPLKKPIRFKGRGRRTDLGMTFNYMGEEYLRPLVFDIFFAHEVKKEGLYELNRKLLSPDIAKSILTEAGEESVRTGRGWFEVLRQGPVRRKEDDVSQRAKEIMFDTLKRELAVNGYQWARYCLEMGQPAMAYQNANHSVRVAMNPELPFYVVRKLNPSVSRKRDLFPTELRSQDPFAVFNWEHKRIDDRTRDLQWSMVMPCTNIRLPEMNGQISLKNQLPPEVVERYREEITKREGKPAKKLRELHL